LSLNWKYGNLDPALLRTSGLSNEIEKIS
jgi:hypothetical protein